MQTGLLSVRLNYGVLKGVAVYSLCLWMPIQKGLSKQYTKQPRLCFCQDFDYRFMRAQGQMATNFNLAVLSPPVIVGTYELELSLNCFA